MLFHYKVSRLFYAVSALSAVVGLSTLFSLEVLAQSVLGQSSQSASTTSSESRPCRYYGKFEQERALPNSDAKISAQGEFLYSCKQGLLWEVREPVVEIMIYTHKGGSFRVRKSRRVRHLQGPVDTRIGETMLGAMSGNMEILADQFTIVEGELIELIPRSSLVAKRLKKITIEHAHDETLINVIAAATGNISIRIFDVKEWHPAQNKITAGNTDTLFCSEFSLFPKPVCRVLSKPADYIAPELD